MEKVKYEKPNFEFQEMRLTERVAEKCWGFGWAFVDGDANPATPPEIYHFVETGGCEGNEEGNSQARLDDLIKKFPALKGKVGLDDVKTNVKDTEFIDPPKKS